MTEPLPRDPPLFERLLIANRAEIAVRIIRACHELNIEAVAIYAAGEERARHVRMADDAYRIAGEATLPYLDITAIVDIARRSGATAVHPGYGFLAENADFAAACAAAGLTFVGPAAAAIRAMGDKIEARRLAVAAGLPVTAGSAAAIESAAAAGAWAERHGYPIAVKAAGGGGGRGFRVARAASEIEGAFTGAASEASRSFANPDVYVEQYLERPRHVEVQILADDFGRVAVLGDRDCSIQRRHQKLIEEAPAPELPAEARRRMAEAAVALARGVEYRSAGTIEFLVVPDGSFYFLEMNTRIQVEHPVTEMTTGVDIVKEQIRIAAGQPISYQDGDAVPRGHAIECRINAEDAGRGFAPTPGLIERYQEPGGFGIRVESAMEPGGDVNPAYDSMIAKLIAWGHDREEAIIRMGRALAEFEITGVATTIPFHQRVMADDQFRRGAVATSFLTERPDLLPPPAALADQPIRQGETAQSLITEVNGRRFVVTLPAELASAKSTAGNGRAQKPPASPLAASQAAAASNANGAELRSPIQGTVLRVPVAVGDPVLQGAVICVVEAMKMENELIAHRDGTIQALHVIPGGAVRIRDLVATIQ